MCTLLSGIQVKECLILQESCFETSKYNNAAIIDTAISGDWRAVEILLCDPRVDPVNENLPIRSASRWSNAEVVQRLLKDSRVDPTDMDNEALSNSYERSFRGLYLEPKDVNPAVAQILLSDPRVDPSVKNNLCLLNAVSYNHIETVRLLLNDNRVNPADNSNVALISALQHPDDSLEILEMLLACENVKPEVEKNIFIRTACSLKIHVPSKLEKLLANSLVNPGACESEAFINAAKSNGVEIIKILLQDSRVNPGAKNSEALVSAVYNIDSELTTIWPSNLPVTLRLCYSTRLEIVELLIKSNRIDAKSALEIANEEMGGDDTTVLTFGQLGVSKWLTTALAQISVTLPTEIQRACIPQILQGRDCIGASQTGSGKTAAFALPILQQLAEDPYGPFALVLAPTRELAFQIAEQFRILGTAISLRLSVIVGGMDMMKQAIELARRPHIIIATPGRLVDLIRSSADTVNLKRIKFLVLDECDRLLHESFSDDLAEILNIIPAKRQTLLFTATMTEEIEELNFGSTKNLKPFVYQCAKRFDTVEKLDQRYVFIPSAVRDAYMAYMVRTMFENKTMIIFAGKCRTAERLRILLRELGVRSTALHAQMSQTERLGSLVKFKSGVVPILIATDVGSRGLDIPLVQVVFNYELPADAADYVHRVGRTARAGRGGLSVSLITERDIDILHNIEEKTLKKMEAYPVPENKVLEALNEVGLAKRVANMHLVDTKFGEKKRANMAKFDVQKNPTNSKKRRVE
ncbi:hypothetical protein HK100_001588 [Physocladia obscura]|uniref:RNA helicase n=1 Tax=Physocladia obscura TaxID=109957 RepID=A0AAD5SXP7_9FUNG|nr:hypothetical protein HK100_001588 [Physocladia obscura]